MKKLKIGTNRVTDNLEVKSWIYIISRYKIYYIKTIFNMTRVHATTNKYLLK